MIEPTFVPSAAEAYAELGRPWDIDTLDAVMADRHQSSPAVVDGETRLSFGELTDAGGRLAEVLAAGGVAAGDTVSIQLANRHETLAGYLACWRLGAVAVPIHSRAGADEVAAAIKQVGSTLHLHDRDRPDTREVPNIDIDHVGTGELSVDENDIHEETARPHSGRGTAAIAVILFTAGSSGEPKAVLHTHRSLGCKARAMVDVHGLTADDVVLMPAPLAHVSGLLNGALVPWAAGMTTVLMAKWDTARALDLIEQEQVSFMVGPPTFFGGLLADPGFSPERVASLRLVSSGGAGVTEAFARETADRLGCIVKRTYGSTEAPTVSTTPADRHNDPLALTTDGRATPATRLRIVDPETRDELGTNDEGELEVSGPELFAGYLDESATALAMNGDWFRTGDLARLDGEGWLTITGRLTDVIIRGGENISPAEVSAVLESHPSVDQAVVVGIRHERLGERVAAFVVATQPFDLETCRDWFESRGVTRFKWPEIVVQLDSIPLLASGKPDLSELRRR